jgi:hypothetical protein
MRFVKLIARTAGLTVALVGIGCGDPGQDYHPIPKDAKVQEQPHEHEHGPHSGHLVELGEEQYHAEVVFDAKASKITIYLLDSTAKNASPTDAKEVTLKLAIGGKPESFSVPAAPQTGDPQGKSSRFELAGNAHIKSHIKDEEDLKGSVTANVGGKSFTGQIKHEHEH